MIRYGIAALGGAALMLCSCSASGGGGSSPTSSAGSTHPAPSSSSATARPTSSTSAKPGLDRTATTTPLGDPVTADVCAGLPSKALSSYGTVTRHGYQAAGACFTDLALHNKNVIQVQVGLYSSAQFHAQSVGGVRRMVGSVPTWVYPPVTGSCERAFQTGSAVVDIVAAVATGTEPGKTLCRVASSALAAEIASGVSTPLPRRAAPTGSFTRFDLCALLSLPSVRREPGMAGARTPTAHDLSGQCSTTTSTDVVRLQVVTIDDDFGHPAATRTIRGKRMQTYTFPGSCEVDAVTGAVPGRAAHEYVAAQVYAAGGKGKKPSFCGTAQGVIADVLTATGIR